MSYNLKSLNDFAVRLVFIQNVLRLKKNKYWQKLNQQLNFEIVSKKMKP